MATSGCSRHPSPSSMNKRPMIRLTPYLCVADARAAIEWYVSALGAEVTYEPIVMDDGRVGHCELAIGEARWMMSDPFDSAGVAAPDPARGTAVSLHLTVTDVDAAAAAVVATGTSMARGPGGQSARPGASVPGCPLRRDPPATRPPRVEGPGRRSRVGPPRRPGAVAPAANTTAHSPVPCRPVERSPNGKALDPALWTTRAHRDSDLQRVPVSPAPFRRFTQGRIDPVPSATSGRWHGSSGDAAGIWPACPVCERLGCSTRREADCLRLRAVRSA